MPVLSWFLHLLMNHLLMMLLCCHLASASYHWILKRFVKLYTLNAITILEKMLFSVRINEACCSTVFGIIKEGAPNVSWIEYFPQGF